MEADNTDGNTNGRRRTLRLRQAATCTSALAAALLGLALASCTENRAPRLIQGPKDSSTPAPFIAAELAKANAQHAKLLVYMGASWCEPCRSFHEALSSGQLDHALAGWRFIEFDYDASHAALERAGYVSRLIPLFAFPQRDGTASARHIEGSIKGPNAVQQNILPRLLALAAIPERGR